MTEPVRRKPGRPKDPARKAAVLEAARDAFAEHGYAGTSLAALAERVSLSKAAVLHHFTSKDALYLEVVAVTLQALIGPVSEAAFGEGDHVKRLDRLTSEVVRELSERPASAKLLIREILGRGPFMRAQGTQAIAAGIGAIVTFLRDGMDAGVFRRQDPVHLAWSIMGAHLLYFAASDVVPPETNTGASQTRAAAMHAQVRAMTLANAG